MGSRDSFGYNNVETDNVSKSNGWESLQSDSPSWEEHIAEFGQGLVSNSDYYEKYYPSRENSDEEIKHKIDMAREAVLNAFEKEKNDSKFETFEQLEIAKMIGGIEYKTDPTYHSNVVEDYRDEYDRQYEKKFGSVRGLEAAVEQFNGLDDKNDLDQLEEIRKLFLKSLGTEMVLPKELEDFAAKLNAHIMNLELIRKGQDVEERGMALLEEKENQERLLAREQEQQQKRRDRWEEPYRVAEDKFQQLFRLSMTLDSDRYPERTKRFKNEFNRLRANPIRGVRSTDYTERDLAALGELNSELDSAIERVSEEKQWQDEDKERIKMEARERDEFKARMQGGESSAVGSAVEAQDADARAVDTQKQGNEQVEKLEVEKQDDEQVEKLKAEIDGYSAQIKEMLEYFKPYMERVPKINAEMQKVIAEDQSVKWELVMGSSPNYQSLVERERALVDYLNRAKDFLVGQQR